jgi:CRISPR-associated protein Csm2
VRQIEMSWPVRSETEESNEEAQQAVRQLILLKPKLAYQASRERRGGIGMAVLRDLMSSAIDLVEADRERFQNLVDFLEAILAYHTAESS